VVDSAYYASMGMQVHVPQGTQPRELAEQLLLQMASFTQDIAMVREGRGRPVPAGGTHVCACWCNEHLPARAVSTPSPPPDHTHTGEQDPSLLL
jgi:hypothetical protein